MAGLDGNVEAIRAILAALRKVLDKLSYGIDVPEHASRDDLLARIREHNLTLKAIRDIPLPDDPEDSKLDELVDKLLQELERQGNIVGKGVNVDNTEGGVCLTLPDYSDR